MKNAAAILIITLLAMAINLAAAFAWVAVYSIFINPGQPDAFYMEYAQIASPISAIVAGIPILFAAGYLAARKHSKRTALFMGGSVGATYALLDSVIVVFAGIPVTQVGVFLLSYSTKIVAAFAGGWLAHRTTENKTQ